jgi:hypothetical protein
MRRRYHQQRLKVFGERGASLVETMVAAALGLIITAAALDVFVMHHGHFVAQRAKSEVQQDIRGGVNLMAAELRLASSITSMRADEIRFRANVNDVHGTVLVVAESGQANARVTPNESWVRGKAVRFCGPDACEDQILTHDGTSGHLALAGILLHDFPVGSHVEVINEVRYYISRTLSTNWKLMREVDHGANPLIEHVEELSLSYVKDRRQPAARSEDVRVIRLHIQTSGIDGHGGRFSRNHHQDMGVRAL